MDTETIEKMSKVKEILEEKKEIIKETNSEIQIEETQTVDKNTEEKQTKEKKNK